MQAGHIVSERYEIRGILGRGGMGEVYLAYDHRLTTEVALKRVPLELSLEPAIRNALIAEARILAKLSHANIVRLFDLADTADGLFMVMEYVCGPSLDKVLLQRKTLTLEEMKHIMGHVASGLTRAHSMGVIHRDLKPSNLLVALNGDQQRHYLRDGTIPPSLLLAEIKVTDFGLAKVIAQTLVEISGHVSGTPGYMAPEQFKGELPSVETDVYALGLVAYVCLAGRSPIGNAEPSYFHLFVTPPPLVGVPAPVNAVIQRAIRKERADRFDSAAAFAEELSSPRPVVGPAAFAPPIPERILTGPKPGEEFKKRLRGRVALAGFAFGIVLLLAAINAVVSKHPRGTSSAVTPSRQSAEVPPAAVSPLPPLNPAPRIDVAPPVIEQFRLTKVPYPLSKGITQPEILTSIRVPGRSMFGFGPDGTLYVTSNTSDIAAVRNGQLLWQYKLANDTAKFWISPDGLIWIYQGGSFDSLFCFNAAGQGGEIVDRAALQKYLPAVLNRSRPAETAECFDSDQRHRDPRVELFLGPARSKWQTPLDHRCHGDPVLGRNGKVLLQTQARTVYLLSSEGNILWTFPASCTLSNTRLLSNDLAVGICDGSRNLIGIRDGQQQFSIQSNNGLEAPFGEDQYGASYRLIDTDVYNHRILIKSDGNGRDVWKLPLTLGLTGDAAMGPDGKIYILSSSPEGDMATVVGERSE